MKSLSFTRNEFNTGFIIKNKNELMSLVGLPIEIFYNDHDNGYIYDKGFVTRIDKIKQDEFVAYSDNRILFSCEYYPNDEIVEGMYAGDDMDLLSFNVLDGIKLFFLKNNSVLNVRGIELAASVPHKTLDHFLKGRRQLNDDATKKIIAVLKQLAYK